MNAMEDYPMPDGVDLARLLLVEGAAVDLARKVAEHKRRCWGTIRVGALDALVEALHGPLPTALPCDADPADVAQAGYADHVGGYPIEDPLNRLLRPEAGTLADRLEQFARDVFPCDGEAS